jgi:hypothetical protein
MENYREDQSYFPTFSKLITWYFTAQNKFPASIGILSFYLCVEAVFEILYMIGVIELSDKLIIRFPFFGLFMSIFIYPNTRSILMLTILLFPCIYLNKLVFAFFPNLYTSRTKLLLTSLIVGLLSFWPANILCRSIFPVFHD